MFDYMDEQNHNLKRNYLDDKRPRVPPLYPPLEDSDVLIVSSGNPQTSTTAPPPSLSTSFAELLLEDRSLLQKGRGGRLSRDNSIFTDSFVPDNCTDINSLRDTIIALQLQNRELSLRLQQERDTRSECEGVIKRDAKYIEKLEETVESLKSSRLVIEPNMYRQIAETYMASRRAPVRRTCSSNLHKNNNYEDLVCDSGSDISLPPSPLMNKNITASDISLPASPRHLTNTSSIRANTDLTNTWSNRASTCNNRATNTAIPLNLHSTNPPIRLPHSPFNRPMQLRQWSSDSNDSNISSDNNFYLPSSTLPPRPPL